MCFKETYKNIRENKYTFLILLLVIIAALYLRLYHIDYPVVGYHNWKETHYLTEARNFAQDGFFKYGFFVPAYDYPGMNAAQSGAHSDTFPLVSILAAVFFKIFGIHLWAARLVGVLFSIGTIVVTFLFVRRLFKREDMAIISALISAILPLYVFFAHNTQMQNPGVFFMLSAAYFYLRWRENDSANDFIIGAVFIALAALTNYPFLVILIPIALTFPYERVKKISMHNLKAYIISAAILSTILLWFLYSRKVGVSTGTSSVGLGLVEVYVIFTKGWWAIIKAYASDNYTLFGVFLAFIGLIAAGAFYKIKAKFEEKFLLAYALGGLLFVMVMSSKLGGHSYHQFPIAPLFVLLISYALVVIGTNLSSTLTSGLHEDKEKTFNALKYGTIILLFVVFLVPANAAKDRQFDTQFFGLDVAGNYIKEHSSPNERIFFSGGQSFGVLWHSERKGYQSLPDVADMQRGEQLGANWIFVYAWGLQELQNPEKMDYISRNYGLAQIATQKNNEGKDEVFYLLFRKGGTFNLSQLNELAQNKPVHSQDYELSKKRTYKIYYINVLE